MIKILHCLKLYLLEIRELDIKNMMLKLFVIICVLLLTFISFYIVFYIKLKISINNIYIHLINKIYKSNYAFETK